MLIVHGWLKEYLGEQIPSAEEIEKLLTFHSFEIEGVSDVNNDAIIDVDVLPNRSSDCLCHRGIAREIATLTKSELAHDPLVEKPTLQPTEKITITREDKKACRAFNLALITDVKVGPSPDWLKNRLEAIGQRSINNIVDATNYVMFAMGQPLHAYDADKFAKDGEVWKFDIKFANAGERVTVLGGEEYELDESIQLITNSADNALAGVAGIKGGTYAEVDENTTTIILEAGNFDPVITRKAAHKLNLKTDASKRFENDLLPELAEYGLAECVALITKIAGGTFEGAAQASFPRSQQPKVSVTLEHIDSLLGVDISAEEVVGILDRLGFEHKESGNTFTVSGPFPRTDINIAEDVIEEVGRIYGYEHVESVVPEAVQLAEVNARHYYSEKIRDTLLPLGFSEVITSSFRDKDEIQLRNALASDKSCLRSNLHNNLTEVLNKNMPYVDLLGLKDVRVFEIGTVFKDGKGKVEESISLALGVQQKQTGYTPKDDEALKPICSSLEEVFDTPIDWSIDRGVAETDLSALLEKLPAPTEYDPVPVAPEMQYQPFSQYPFVTRDIALWTPEGTTSATVEETLREHSGDLLVRLDLFDEFKKDGRVSYAFRLIFQSKEKTLTDEIVNAIMDEIYTIVGERNWEVR